jgi:hypothetical protein
MKKWGVVPQPANPSWPIFEDGTLIAEVHAGYEVAKEICQRHNHCFHWWRTIWEEGYGWVSICEDCGKRESAEHSEECLCSMDRQGRECKCGAGKEFEEYQAVIEENDSKGALPPKPVQLFCPQCGVLHLDEGEWATRPHKTHQCQSCKHEWRPFPYPTVGVAEVSAPEPPKCPDCDKAATFAYSDAVTPGFFSPKCPKHRAEVSAPEPPKE